MSGQQRNVFINSRSRLLSSDFNDSNRLRTRAQILGMMSDAEQEAYRQVTLGIGGVWAGFTVTAVTGSNVVRIQPGIAFFPVTVVAADELYDAEVVWIETHAAEDIDLGSFVDGGNPRLITIEVRPDEDDELTRNVDIFDPVTGTFTVAPALPVVKGSVPLFSTAAGVPALNPQVAAGTADRLPLAIVKLAAGQVSFTDDYAPVLMCRPLLRGTGKTLLQEHTVRGGGFSVGEESGGSIVNLTTAEMHEMVAELEGLPARGSGSLEFLAAARTLAGVTSADLLSAVQPVYGYLCSPPWRQDYGVHAPREAWHRNPNLVAFTDPQNIVGGAVGKATFRSLALAGGSLRNAILVWDTVAPTGTSSGAGNAPLRVLDARGEHPVTAGGGVLTLEVTAAVDSAWGNPGEQQCVRAYYAGAVCSLGTAPETIMAVQNKGAGEMRVIDALPLGTERRPLFSTTLAAAFAPFYPGNYPGMLVGDATLIPFASAVDVAVRLSAGSGGVVTLNVVPAFGFGGAEPPGFTTATSWSQDADNFEFYAFERIKLELAADVSALYDFTPALLSAVQFVLSAYQDPFLAARG